MKNMRKVKKMKNTKKMNLTKQKRSGNLLRKHSRGLLGFTWGEVHPAQFASRQHKNTTTNMKCKFINES